MVENFRNRRRNININAAFYQKTSAVDPNDLVLFVVPFNGNAYGNGLFFIFLCHGKNTSLNQSEGERENLSPCVNQLDTAESEYLGETDSTRTR